MKNLAPTKTDTCMYGSTLHQCFSSGVAAAEADSGERGVKTSGAYYWLLLSEGGGGPEERREDEERGWERGCVRKEEGK